MVHFDAGETGLTLLELTIIGELLEPTVADHRATAIGGTTSSRQKPLFFLLSFGFPSGKNIGSQPLVIDRREWKDGEGSGKQRMVQLLSDQPLLWLWPVDGLEG